MTPSQILFHTFELMQLYCNILLLLLSFSTPEQARIGIPTVADSSDSHANPPAIVIYIVDAFLTSSGARNEGGEEEEGDEVEAGSIWLLGLLRCYTEMLQTLPETMRPALVLQVGRHRFTPDSYSLSLLRSSSHSFHRYVSYLGGVVPVPSPASQWREPFVPAASALPGLLLLLPMQASAAPANTHQVPDWLWAGVHCQFCT